MKNKITPALTAWQDGLEHKVHAQPAADVLLLVGTGANQNPEHAASARKLARLLEHADVTFEIL